MSDFVPIPREASEVLCKATTGMVNDALAMVGLNGGIAGVRPARGAEDAKIVARVATILFGPPRPDSPKLSMYQTVRDTPPGCLLVIDGKGLDAHFTGDNQAECAKRQGLAGVVVYGGSRDIAGFRALGLPLYCTGSATVDKPSHFQVIGYNVPIEVAGVTVRPGDIMTADEDGVVCIPAEALSATIEKLRVIFSVEEAMEKAIGSCAPVDEIKAIIGRKKAKK
jgi:4-hydroxy-4-methyl-2-oxoglutarate aldolase